MDPAEHPVLLTERPHNPKANRIKSIETMFETFKVPSLYLADQGALSLCAIGFTTGLVFTSGDGISFAIPVYDGHSIPHATLELEVSGRELTDFLSRLMLKSYDDIIRHYNYHELVRDIKEKLCYVALDFEQELIDSKKSDSFLKSYEKVDGSIVTLGSERFKCPEVLFRPSMLGFGKIPDGVHKIIHDSIMMCDADLHADLYENICLSGGNTMFPGFANRLQKEISALVPSTVDAKIVADPRRKYLTWMGGSCMMSDSCYSKSYISKLEYEEYGASIFNKKCF